MIDAIEVRGRSVFNHLKGEGADYLSTWPDEGAAIRVGQQWAAKLGVPCHVVPDIDGEEDADDQG